MSPAAPAAGGAKRSVAAAAGAQATKAEAAKPKNSGITKPVPVSDAMRKFVGADQVSRSGAVKLIWDHIKAKGLQVLHRYATTPVVRISNSRPKLVG